MAFTSDSSSVGAPHPRPVCLLPARNAEADLDGYFAAIAGVCDAVVTLDDGDGAGGCGGAGG